MQDWKIKRMSVKLLEKWLLSIDCLLSHYLRMKKLRYDSCPLCWSDCKDCLWWIIEGKACVDMMKELYPGRGELGAAELRVNLRYKKWKDARIKQLQNWREIMTSELAGRYINWRKK